MCTQVYHYGELERKEKRLAKGSYTLSNPKSVGHPPGVSLTYTRRSGGALEGKGV
jgi:hypothetical protein